MAAGRRILSLAVLALMAPSARADLLVRIGDIDGFGYGAAPGFKAASGGAANANGDPVLSQNDFLPDINKDGAVAWNRGDDFDLRSAAERAGNAYSINGAIVNSAVGTTGSQFTDISLSRSYDATQAAHHVLTGGNPNTGLVFGNGGAFPAAPSNTLPNQPGFVFQLSVDKANLIAGSPIYFNMIFGDYDVTPAKITITDVNGHKQDLSLTVQPGGQDGLIQGAYAALNFGDLFSDGGSTWNGYMKIDFVAPNEPYTAFDYVELSTQPISLVPEPTSLVMLGVGALASIGLATRRRK